MFDVCTVERMASIMEGLYPPDMSAREHETRYVRSGDIPLYCADIYMFSFTEAAYVVECLPWNITWFHRMLLLADVLRAAIPISDSY